MSFLNRNIFNFSKGVCGLDLSDLSVKVVQIKNRGDEADPVSYGNVPIPQGSVVDGEIINKENVVQAIKTALEKAQPKKITAKKVICSLPETKGFLRIINLPKMQEEEVSEAIKWEIEANIPLSIDQVYYDWQVLDKNFSKEEEKMSVLVIAVSKKIEDQLLEVLDLCDLHPVGFEIESIAQARSLINEKKDQGKTTLVIDLGDRRTSFFILLDGVPCFTSSIPLSAQALTGAISKALNLSIEEAENKKIEFGIGSDVKRDPIFIAVEPILENLVSEIERSVDFYVDGLQYSKSIDKVIMCGGGSKTKGIIPYLSKRIGMEIEKGDPWTNFSQGGDISLIEKEKTIQFSTAIGLALKGLYNV